MPATLRWTAQAEAASLKDAAAAERASRSPTIKNHTATHIGRELFVFGGYDGLRNHNAVHVLDCESLEWREAEVSGDVPAGRNGHTATLANGHIFVIGGWLGSGPLAACDMYVLEIETMRWSTSHDYAPPGPCNMHTTDFIPSMNQLLVFRGGDGREYLNSLHVFDLASRSWWTPPVTGDPPLPRANHSSAVVGTKLYVFGGWDGNKRLNDIHILDAATMRWSAPRIGGRPPSPRAGMTFTQVRDRIFLFGGSGPSAKCFNDLQIFDTKKLEWLNITTPEELHASQAAGGGNASGKGGNTNNIVNSSNHKSGGGGTVSTESASNAEDGGSALDVGGAMFASKYSEIGDDLAENNESGESYGAHLSGRDAMSSGAGLTASMGIGEGDSDVVDENSSGGGANSFFESKMGSVVQDGSNPNGFGLDYQDEDTYVIVQGTGPGHRAGHTTTVVDDRRLFVFGGSYGTEYLNDFFILDTDPPPMVQVSLPSSMSQLHLSLRDYCNDEQFSDIEFLVEDRVVYGHKVILSLLSERFRAMFSSGFMESTQAQIPFEGIRHASFMSMLEYLYSGVAPAIVGVTPNADSGGDEQHDRSVMGVTRVVELLQLSDQFMLDHLKQICEVKLKAVVREENVDAILEHGEMFNAEQIVAFCRHYKRNYCSHGSQMFVEDDESSVGAEPEDDKGLMVMGLGGGGSSVDSAVFADGSTRK